VRAIFIILRMSIFIESEKPLKINILVLPETSMMCLAAVLEPMRVVNQIMGSHLLDWSITTLDGASVTLSCGITISADEIFSQTLEGDLMLLMAGMHYGRYMDRIDFIHVRQAAQNHRSVGGIESGAWVLAHTGLLNDKRATTHWENIEDFAVSFPSTEVVNDRFVIDGNFFTTGGSTSTIDLMLSLIQIRYGTSIATEASAMFIYESLNQSYDKHHIVSTTAIFNKPNLVAKAIRLMEQSLDEPKAIADLAKALKVSKRKLEIDFVRAIEKTPGVYYRELRARNASRMIANTSLDIREIAIRTGFSSLSNFSRCFKNIYQVSPIQYRQARLWATL
jgi:transcriptional regulator GlxA family with amidase domain